ncbi:MAG: acyl-CoA desaturase [Gemmatimonadetes bacterium]|nr:acyl-CoA desaturase [Gemmatimonadota bacterium]
MAVQAVTFPAKDGATFAAEVKREVDEYFARTGRSPKANLAMVVKTVTLLAVTFGSYFAILLAPWGAWVKLALAAVMGLGFAGIGFAIVHDALHGAYSSKPWINKALGRLFDLLGANGYLWKITHNVIHHTYTNIEGIDEDLTVSPLLRLSPTSPLRPVHRFQHWYGLLAYAGSTLFWVFSKDFKYILQRNLGPYLDIKHPPGEVVNLLVTKLIYYGWGLVVPLLVIDLPWWQILIGFLVMHLVAGFVLGVVFQLAHVVEGPDFPAPDASGRMADSWLVHEMRTTADFARSNRLLSWYVGGLNFQIEHHLFPKVCSVHYPAIAPIVESVAARHGIPYHAHPSLMAAVRSHQRMLKQFGPEAWAARDRSALATA